MQPIVKFGLTKASINTTLHTAFIYWLVLLEASNFLTSSRSKEQAD